MIGKLKKYYTGNIKADCIQIYSAYGNYTVLSHVKDVAEMAVSLSKKENTILEKIKTAAYLHDISVVIPRADYALICKKYNIEVLDIEKELPILMHQKVSGIIAKEIFKIDDTDIVSAISCHTTLKANPSEFDKLIFIADKLAWDQKGEPPFKKNVEIALTDSINAACLVYIDYIINNNIIIKPHPDLLSARVWLKEHL